MLYRMVALIGGGIPLSVVCPIFFRVFFPILVSCFFVCRIGLPRLVMSFGILPMVILIPVL